MSTPIGAPQVIGDLLNRRPDGRVEIGTDTKPDASFRAPVEHVGLIGSTVCPQLVKDESGRKVLETCVEKGHMSCSGGDFIMDP